MIKNMHATGMCPICNGTGNRPCPDNLRKYGQECGWYGCRAIDDTVDCTNCGAQYMFGTPTGQVRLNRDGVPCVHLYDSANAGRCYTRYTCKHCGDVYHIDSGD